jgi:hypothetical protein
MAEPDFHRLSLLAQTAYARLLDLLMTAEVGGPEETASPVAKTIRGRRYWYLQRYQAGKKVQRYLGPETPEVVATIERLRRRRDEKASRAELIAMARAGGAHIVGAVEAEVLERLAPVFRVGGVLVGSHAFAVIGNSLGARWRDALARTEDVDIAHDRRMALALARDVPATEVSRVLGDAIPRFSVLSPTHPATVFRMRGSDIEVDLLTPMVGRTSSRPVRIEPLGVAATPLRFLDYLIDETQPGAVMGGSGVLVNVPRAGRFALHKLIIAARRGTASPGRSKAPKDRAQAGALLRLLVAELPGEITLAWKALAARGQAWRSAAARSLRLLDPELVASLRALGVPSP